MAHGDGYHEGARRSQPATFGQERGFGRSWQLIRALRRVMAVLALILLPIALLAGIGAALVYVRLSNGPVSLSYLTPTIERQVSEKLGGLNVAISDVVLSMAGQGAEIRLKDVRLRHGGEVVAQAPQASMEYRSRCAVPGAGVADGHRTHSAKNESVLFQRWAALADFCPDQHRWWAAHRDRRPARRKFRRRRRVGAAG